MHQIVSIVFICLISMLLFTGCGHNSSAEHSFPRLPGQEPEIPGVRVLVLKRNIFEKEIYSYGRLVYRQMKEVRCEADGIAKSIKMFNGQMVQAGDTLAVLDTTEQWIQFRKKELELQRSFIDLQDLLLSHGKKLGSEDGNTALINQSGYGEAQLALLMARSELDKRYIRAPYPGILTDVDIAAGEQLSRGQKVAKMVTGDEKCVEAFLLPETSRFLKLHTKAVIYPRSVTCSENALVGSVIHISPTVNENGFVKIEVLLNDSEIQLPEGSYLSTVFLVPGESGIMIPKTSVAIRSGKKVVFVVEDGRAKWRNIFVSGENSESYRVEKGLEEGDSLIVTGSLFLAHDAPVKILESE